MWNQGPNERLDDLQNGLYILQDPQLFCFGIDAVLLSAYARVNKRESCLDLGTGNGILPLLLCSKNAGGSYVGLELNGHTWGQVVTMHLLEYISAAYTPLPGASGAQEAVFSIYFGKIFSGPSTLAGLLLWRFFTYYIAIIGGAVVVIVGGLREGRSLREMAQMGDTPPAMPDADAGNGGL